MIEALHRLFYVGSEFFSIDDPKVGNIMWNAELSSECATIGFILLQVTVRRKFFTFSECIH